MHFCSQNCTRPQKQSWSGVTAEVYACEYCSQEALKWWAHTAVLRAVKLQLSPSSSAATALEQKIAHHSPRVVGSGANRTKPHANMEAQLTRDLQRDISFAFDSLTV